MAKGNDYRMAIKIAGEIEKSLYNSTDLTRKELNKIAREAARTSSMTKDSFAQGLKDTEPFFDGLEKAGVKTFNVLATAAAAAGTAIIGIGTVSANVGIDFESSFAGVKKTTDATTQEYAKMKQEILEMTREIPAAGTEIAAVAEAAGQLGIEKENLLAFTRTMIDLGESTNLASEEAATAMAKFANITNMEAQYYDELGSVIVSLGNNFATTEADIVSMATRLASAGELAGFSEPQIMAMSTAMSSVGIEAEAGGTAMSKMIKRVQVAVETGDKSLKKYASVAGMSVNEFKEAFAKDGLTAVASFISGLNDVERNGKSATVILNEMGLKEANLSNTLLSLANADELMLKAVTKANEAWEENTALSEEAGKRYETTESKLAIMKNGFTEMGITMYDQFNEPLRDGIDMITELVHEATAEIAGSTVIHDIAQDIVEGVPTAIRLAGDFAGAVGDFAQPFLTVGGWLADHPKLLESTITGVGSALVTYKAAKGIASLATAFTSLGAASLPVLGLTGVAAAIGGVTVAVKKSAAEAKKANLDEHFGKMTLSMQEMQDVAAYIVSNDSFGQLQASIEELRELDGLNESIDDSIDELNRMNWKISIGMQLKEEEQELYKQNIANYIADVQSYVEQEQYAVSLSVGLLTGEELENSNIVTQLNAFYEGKNTELAEIGTKLNQAVTDAFQDGLLSVDESKTISELQQQMANIKASLAMGSYESNLDLLGMKYAGGELDAETFMNLQAEIAEQQELARQKYDEAYVAYSNVQRTMLSSGEITQEEYDANMRKADTGYLQQVGSLDEKAINFQLDTIIDHYGNEIGDLMSNIDNNMGMSAANAIEILAGKNGFAYKGNILDYDVLTKDLNIDAISDDTRLALADLWKGLEPQREQLEELRNKYIEAGEEVPAYVNEGINKANAIGILSGDIGSVYSAYGQEAIENQGTANLFKGLNGGDLSFLPNPIKEALESQEAETYETVTNSILKYRDYIEQQMQTVFAEDMNIDAKVNINFSNNKPLSPAPSLKGYSEGGIVTQPEIAWLAEGGYSESVIPHDGSPRSISLWQQTGEILGVFNRKDGFHALKENLLSDYGSGGSSVSNTVNNAEDSRNIVFSPTIQISGNADRRDIEDVMELAFEKFEELLEQHERNRERFSFQQ